MKKVIGFAVIALFAAGCSGSGGNNDGGGGSTGNTGSCNPGTSVTNPTIDPGCGTTSLQGSCSGSTLTYCTQNDLPDGGTGPVSIDCSQIVSGDTSISCGFVDKTFGYDCISAPNTECVFGDGQGGIIVQFCQGGCGTGCNFNTGNCQTGVTPCTGFSDGGSPPPVCDGNKLQIECREFQPVFIDCAALNGSCNLGQCVNLPAGSPCDPSGQGALLVCASGHTCVAVDGGNVCQ